MKESIILSISLVSHSCNINNDSHYNKYTHALLPILSFTEIFVNIRTFQKQKRSKICFRRQNNS